MKTVKIMALGAMLAAAGLSAAETTAKFGGKTWRLCPAGVKASLSADGQGSLKLTVQDGCPFVSLAADSPASENRHYWLSFRFETMADFIAAPDSRMTVKVNFSRANGSDGGAGTAMFPLKPGVSGESVIFSEDVLSPLETSGCKIVIFDGSNVKGSVIFRDFKFEPVRDRFEIKKTDSPPVVDGVLDDGVWRNAEPLTPFYRPDSNAEPAIAQTVALMAFDDQNLWLAFKNSGEPASGERDGVLIALPDGSVRSFFVGADGSASAGQTPGNGWIGAARRGNDGWTAEISVSLADLKFQPSSGAALAVSLVRDRPGGRSLFCRVTGSFEDSSKFAWLNFSGKSAKLTRQSENGTGKQPQNTEGLTGR
jgi:hypothetical protein